MSAGEALLPPQGDKGHPISPLFFSGFHEHRSRCNPNPCFSGVDCMETYEYPGYRCGPCPPGLEGNGTHCADIDEVGTLPGQGSGTRPSLSAAGAARADDVPLSGCVLNPRKDTPGQWPPRHGGCRARG